MRLFKAAHSAFFKPRLEGKLELPLASQTPSVSPGPREPEGAQTRTLALADGTAERQAGERASLFA